MVRNTSAMNHMRNIVYHMIKWMKNQGLSDTQINKRLHRMGSNIADTEKDLFQFNKG